VFIVGAVNGIPTASQPTAIPPTPISLTPTTPSDVANTPVAENRLWTPIEQVFEGIPYVLVPVGCFLTGEQMG